MPGKPGIFSSAASQQGACPPNLAETESIRHERRQQRSKALQASPKSTSGWKAAKQWSASTPDHAACKAAIESAGFNVAHEGRVVSTAASRSGIALQSGLQAAPVLVCSDAGQMPRGRRAYPGGSDWSQAHYDIVGYCARLGPSRQRA